MENDSQKCHIRDHTSSAKHPQSNAICKRLHSTLGSSPVCLVFNRDMILSIPLNANWHAITQKREYIIHENLMQENQKRRRYDYIPEQCILKKCWKPCKLDARTSGPYRVLQTHVNSTVTIELRPGVSECVCVCVNLTSSRDRLP
jgi:hypothetical protein